MDGCLGGWMDETAAPAHNKRLIDSPRRSPFRAQTRAVQVDYWLPDPDIKPTKFRVTVMRPDNQGTLKLLKKASSARVGLSLMLAGCCLHCVVDATTPPYPDFPLCADQLTPVSNTPPIRCAMERNTGGLLPPGVPHLRAAEQRPIRVHPLHHAPVQGLPVAGTHTTLLFLIGGCFALASVCER